MHSLKNPPGATETVHAERVLVLAPHYDDEILGCGGLITTLAAEGSTVRVLFLTDSSGGRGGEAVEDPESYASLRRREAEAAVEVLAEAGDLAVHGRLDLPDGELHRRIPEAAEGIGAAIRELEPDLVLVTSPLEISSDHAAAFAALHHLLTAIRPGHELHSWAEGARIFAYEVNHLQHPDLLVDVSPRLSLLKRAMGRYASQQARHDYWAAYEGRSRFRALTLPPGVEAVEAYRRLRPEDFAHRGLAALVEHLGGRRKGTPIAEGPLVSVVVRTHNRPRMLAEALASIGESDYRQIEVVVVNDGGDPPRLPEDYPFELRFVDLQPNRGRAAAATAGVEAARGDYVAFLDDDDLVEPRHYAVLVGAVRAAGVRVAYSDAAVGVYHLEGEEGWKLVERRLPYSRDFDPDRLRVDNYIPFHTLLIERGLFAEVGGFDEKYPIFEDWEFLLRLARVTPFHHIPRVSCEYRQFRGAGHHVLGDRPREREDFLALKAEVIASQAAASRAVASQEETRDGVEAELVARVVDGLRAETVAAEETARRERQARRGAEEDFHRTRGALRAAEELGRQLETLEARARQELATVRAELRAAHGELEAMERQVAELHAYQEEQSTALRAAYGEIERLNGVVRSMEGTRAWKMHRKIQGWKP